MGSLKASFLSPKTVHGIRIQMAAYRVFDCMIKHLKCFPIYSRGLAFFVRRSARVSRKMHRLYSRELHPAADFVFDNNADLQCYTQGVASCQDHSIMDVATSSEHLSVVHQHPRRCLHQSYSLAQLPTFFGDHCRMIRC